MALNPRERAIAAVANAISVYVVMQQRGEVPDGLTMHGHILGSVPESVRPEVSAVLIDDVFAAVASAHDS